MAGQTDLPDSTAHSSKASTRHSTAQSAIDSVYLPVHSIIRKTSIPDAADQRNMRELYTGTIV